MNVGRKYKAKRDSEELAAKAAVERGLELKPSGSKYEKEWEEFLINNSYGHHKSEIQEMFAEEFGIWLTCNQISGFLKNRHISTGLTGRFEKGHPTWNKGMKVYTGGEKGWFKKGHIPKNHREVGEERISVDGYVEIKVAEHEKWKLKHRIIWEQEHGPIPENMAVTFRDGNKLNLDIDNLMLVSKGQVARVNHEFPGIEPDLIESAYKYAELKLEINKRIKENGKQK